MPAAAEKRSRRQRQRAALSARPGRALGACLPDIRRETGASGRRFVPVSAECLNEEHAGGDPAHLDVHRCQLRRQCGVLRGYDLQVGDEAALIAIVGLIERTLRGGDGSRFAGGAAGTRA